MRSKSSWTIEFYVDARGKCPARESRDKLSPAERAKLLRSLDLLMEFGPRLGLPHARPIQDMWELRGGSGRLFYVAHASQRFIVLHGYSKKSRKAPLKEVETAKRRWSDFIKDDSCTSR